MRWDENERRATNKLLLQWPISVESSCSTTEFFSRATISRATNSFDRRNRLRDERTSRRCLLAWRFELPSFRASFTGSHSLLSLHQRCIDAQSFAIGLRARCSQLIAHATINYNDQYTVNCADKFRTQKLHGIELNAVAFAPVWFMPSGHLRHLHIDRPTQCVRWANLFYFGWRKP